MEYFKLGNCHTLYLSGCKFITDKSVEKLINCHTLYLYGTKITNITIYYLRSKGVIVNN